MTEGDWDTSTDPRELLTLLRLRGLTERKTRLFAVACCRRVWHLLTGKRSRRAVEVAERYADGQATEEELSAARTAGWEGAQWQPNRGMVEVEALGAAARSAWPPEHTLGYQTAALMYEIRSPAGMALLRDLIPNSHRFPLVVDPAWLAWNDHAVEKLALAAYEERQLPSGHLDPHRLAVLADALEEAGCSDPDILGHLRQPGAVHVRGCWVVDLLTAKE